MPKHKYLLTYRYAEIIHDLTAAFCQKYVDYKSRTKDQTCPHCYAKRCRRVEQAARIGSLIEKPALPGDPANDANFLLTLCHQVTYLLNKQIISLEDKFVNQGGYTENLFRRRLDSKIGQKVSYRKTAP